MNTVLKIIVFCFLNHPTAVTLKKSVLNTYISSSRCSFGSETMSINVRNVSKISGSYTANPLASDLFFREKRREGSACDAALLSAGDMSDPSPSPSHDDGLHALLVAAGEKLLVGDSLRLENTQDPSEVLCMEGGQLVQVTLRHLPEFRAVQ